MKTLKRNTFFNFAGDGTNIVCELLLVPLYLHYLGSSQYATIAIFKMLEGMAAAFDFGITRAINREMAVNSGQQNKYIDLGSFIYTMEVIYYLIGVLVLTLMLSLTPWLTQNTLNLSAENRLLTLIIYAALLFRWPFNFYRQALSGLQQQALLNKIEMAFSLINAATTTILLVFISTEIVWIFVCFTISAILQFIFFRNFFFLHSQISKLPVHFNFNAIKQIKGFSGGVASISLTVTFSRYLDRIFVARFLNLDMFAYYSLALTISGGALHLIRPIFSSFFPSFSSLVSLKREKHLIQIYHLGCQFVAVVIFPISITIAFFSQEFLWIWTHGGAIVESAENTLSILCIVILINGTLHIPYAIQLANGWTKLSFYQNLVTLVIMYPLLYFMVHHFALTGAASSRLILNAISLLISINIMHCYILKGEKWKWFIQDNLIPLLLTVIVVWIFKILKSDHFSGFITILYMATAYLASLSVCILAATEIRTRVLKYFT